MAQGLFRTYSEDVLLNMRERLTQALLDVATGDKVVFLMLGGKQYTFSQSNVDAIKTMLDEVNYGLQYVNPTAYGKRVTHTHPNFDVITADLK